MSERPSPKRPYRDSLVLNIVLAVLIVLISWGTGGDLGRAFVIAALFFVVSTAWSWWRLRQRFTKDKQ